MRMWSATLLLRAAAAGLALTGAACGKQTQAQTSAQARAPLPALTGRVVDEAGLLSQDPEATLTGKLAALEAATTDQFVVVTVNSLGGRSIEAFGLALGRGWGIGQKGVDNGVLLIVAPAERQVRIEVGTGLERVLTDDGAARIVQDVLVPHYRRGEMEAGTLEGADAIIAVLRASPVRRTVFR